MTTELTKHNFLPEGITEQLAPHAYTQEVLRRKLIDCYHSWGYDLVSPPLLEYLNSLLTERAKNLELETFKLTDQISGKLIGIRADMTPQIARIDAQLNHTKTTARYCYQGQTLKTNKSFVDSIRNPFQIGVEIFGHTGIESDIEVIQLMLETMKLAGLKSNCINLGHTLIANTVLDEAGFKEDIKAQLNSAIQKKSFFEVDRILETSDVSLVQKELIKTLPRLYGHYSILRQARDILADCSSTIAHALDELEQCYQFIKSGSSDVTVYFDLSEQRGYGYHTGLLYSAYAEPFGHAVAHGGRYEVAQTGSKSRPACGFSTWLDLLSRNYKLQSPAYCVLAYYSDDSSQHEMIQSLRAQGHRVVVEFKSESAVQNHIYTHELQFFHNEWQLVKLEGN